MTYRRFWMLPAFALCLAAAVAVAQQTYPQQAWAPPQQACPLAQSTGYPVAQPIPAPSQTCILSADEGKVQLQTADGGRATCESLTILVNGVEPIKVAVADKRVQLQAGAEPQIGNTHDSLRASADRVSRSGPEGKVFTLEGNARLILVRKGKKADLVSDRIAVNLANGYVETSIGGTLPAPTCPTPGNTCPATPPVPPTAPAETLRIPPPQAPLAEHEAPTVPLRDQVR